MKDKSKTVITVIEPGSSTASFFRSQFDAVRDVYLARFLIWRMFRRDFAAQFRQKLLGYAWAFLAPFMGVASFLIMYSAGVLTPGDTGIPYPLYAMFGNSTWALAPGSMAAVSLGLQNQADLIMRTNIPKMALALSSLATFFYALMVNTIVVVLTGGVVGYWPTTWALFYPLMVIPLIALGVGMGLVLAVIGTIARDLTNIASTGLGIMVFIMPVAYTQAQIKQPILATMMKYNPLTYLIQVPRDVFYFGKTAFWPEYLAASALCIFILSVSIFIFYKIQDLVAERL